MRHECLLAFFYLVMQTGTEAPGTTAAEPGAAAEADTSAAGDSRDGTGRGGSGRDGLGGLVWAGPGCENLHARR